MVMITDVKKKKNLWRVDINSFRFDKFPGYFQKVDTCVPVAILKIFFDKLAANLQGGCHT
jgi:hypothetical protein